MSAFTLRNVPLLSRIGADRDDQVRTDIDAAIAGWPDAAVLHVDRRNQVLISGSSVVLSKTTALGDTPPDHAVFLGTLADGRHVWAIRGALEAPEDDSVETEVLDLRRAGPIFDDASAQLVATATALLNWHDAARFSPVDGSPTKTIKAGWARINPVNGQKVSIRRSSAWCTTATTGRCLPARPSGRNGCSHYWPASWRQASRSSRVWSARSRRRSGSPCAISTTSAASRGRSRAR